MYVENRPSSPKGIHTGCFTCSVKAVLQLTKYTAAALMLVQECPLSFPSPVALNTVCLHCHGFCNQKTD